MRLGSKYKYFFPQNHQHLLKPPLFVMGIASEHNASGNYLLTGNQTDEPNKPVQNSR